MDAIILAGGENKRFPVIKGFLEVDGKRIIDFYEIWSILENRIYEMP